MTKDHCGTSRTKPKPGCQTTKASVKVQPFPKSGPLADNLGVPLPILESKIAGENARAYSYILSPVKLNHKYSSFRQFGSAPNFQGGLLTLCTCKHQMRATRPAAKWKDVWLAGFTSRTIYDDKHWLFYLAKIDEAHESQADLWQAVKARTRNAKVADRHFLGDIFRPKSPMPTGSARYTASRYVAPSDHAHRQHRLARIIHRDITLCCWG